MVLSRAFVFFEHKQLAVSRSKKLAGSGNEIGDPRDNVNGYKQESRLGNFILVVIITISERQIPYQQSLRTSAMLVPARTNVVLRRRKESKNRAPMGPRVCLTGGMGCFWIL